MDQLYTLIRVLEGAWEFAQPVHMYFVDLERALDCLPWGVPQWGVLRDYGVSDRSQSLLSIAGSRSDLFPVRVGLKSSEPSRCPLSLTVFITFMDRISRHRQGAEGVRFGNLRIGSLLFAGNVVSLAPSVHDLQPSVKHVQI